MKKTETKPKIIEQEIVTEVSCDMCCKTAEIRYDKNNKIIDYNWFDNQHSRYSDSYGRGKLSCSSTYDFSGDDARFQSDEIDICHKCVEKLIRMIRNGQIK